LLLAAVLADDCAVAACRQSLEAGLVVNAPSSNVLRFAPSLLVTDPDIDHAVGIVGRVLARLQADPGSGGTAATTRPDLPSPPDGSDGP
jgi:acetylornithine/succinyldiaminopimelate/putrescine aminotransferase